LKALYLDNTRNIEFVELSKKISDTYQIKNTTLSYKINPESVTYISKELLYGLIKPKFNQKEPIFFLYSNEPSPININLMEEGFKTDNDIVDENYLAEKFDLVLQESLNKNSQKLNSNSNEIFKTLRVVLIIEWLIVFLLALPILFNYITSNMSVIW
jgi:hypothetical protein|tara:strand:- start:2539 stop:3009 length:471 start_codon:yes stop_codon:yes gene_type:complete